MLRHDSLGHLHAPSLSFLRRLIGLLACQVQAVDTLSVTSCETSVAFPVSSDVHSYVFCHAQASRGHRHIHNGLTYMCLRAG